MTTPAFRQWVDRARGEHVNAILAARHIQLNGKGNRRAGPCPKCGGEDRFAVELDKQLFNCRGCGGKGHGAISLVQFLDGIGFLQAVEEITGEPPPQKEPKQAKQQRRARGRLVCSYPYVDELGAEQFEVRRYADPKSFSQHRPDLERPGQWIANLNGVRMVPYRLPDMIEGMANGYPVYWCEGEKDADNGAALGLVTTTTAMGLAGKGHWERGAYDEFFKDADVILVPDQDEDEHKGRELARVIAKRLKPIAASVRVLNLPVKDLSDWVEGGGTREMLDSMELVEPVVTNGGNGNGHHVEVESGFAELWQPPGDEIKAQVPVPVPLIYPFPIIAKEIPRRPWVVPGLLLRRHVSVLVAPPGSGKSLLTLQMALMMSTGMSWGGWHPRGICKVLVINSEDDSDEMRRRLTAAVDVMRCNEEELRDRIAMADQPESIIIARADMKTKTVVRTPMIENIIVTIEQGGFDVLIVDPFAETFEGDENSNSELKWAAVLWREIARRTNCAVMLVHHTRKYATQGAGDMDSARGAGALVGVARVVSTLFTMTEQEADAFEIESERRHEYLRFDDAKANLSLVTFKARWFFKRTYTLPNGGTEDEKPDDVGVLEPWRPQNVFDKLDASTARVILLKIDKGVILPPEGPTLATDDGKPVPEVPDLYTLTRRGRSTARWAGNVVQAHVPCADKDAQRILNTWFKNGVLIEVEQETSTSKGQKRKGLRINMAKLPGTLMSEDSL